MRRFMMIAAASTIALVGLSANQCGGGGDKADTAKPAEEAPAAAPADTAPTDTAPAEPTDTSPGDTSTQ